MFEFQKKNLWPGGPQVFNFGHQISILVPKNFIQELMEYNKRNIFYLALTAKECFRLSFELAFEWFPPEARLPTAVRKNEPALKCKSPQTGIQGSGNGIHIKINKL